MALKLFLLRHGETTYSRSGGFCGSLDPELTEKGAQMAQEFADHYKAFGWTAAYVSPMKRTIATAKPLCEADALFPLLRDGLKEIAYGQWEGKTVSQVEQEFPDQYHRWLTEPAWNAPPGGGETAIQVANRASVVVSEITESFTDGNILIVSHKATIRLLLCSFLGVDLGRYRDRLDAPAGSLSVVQFGAYGPRLETLGDRSYMSAELRALPGT